MDAVTPARRAGEGTSYAVIGAGAAVLPLHVAAVEAVGGRWVGACARSARTDDLDCPYFDDHRALLDACPPDVAVILTPHESHAAISLDCLAAGAHVLVEKPLATTVPEADAVVAAARSADRLVGVAFQQRFRPEVAAARTLLESGALGRLQRVVLDASWPWTRSYFQAAAWRGTWSGEGGGVLMNQGVHQLDLLCHLLGPPAVVSCWTRTLLHEIETEDTVQGMLGWPSGLFGSIHMTTAAEEGWERFEIHGTAGAIELWQGGIRFRRFESDLRDHVASASGFKSRPGAAEVEVEVGDGPRGHVGVYVDFEAALASGDQPRSNAASTRESLMVANAAILSGFRDGTPIVLPIDPTEYEDAIDQLRSSGAPLRST